MSYKIIQIIYMGLLLTAHLYSPTCIIISEIREIRRNGIRTEYMSYLPSFKNTDGNFRREIIYKKPVLAI